MTRVKSILYGSVATIALSGFAGSAYAADMDFKAPVVGDLKVSFYGTFDINGYCQDHGTQAPGDAVPRRGLLERFPITLNREAL